LFFRQFIISVFFFAISYEAGLLLDIERKDVSDVELLMSARGVKIPFGDREVLNKVADLPDTEEYKTDNGNYITIAERNFYTTRGYRLTREEKESAECKEKG